MTRRRNWNGIEGPKLTRFKEAYLGMARRARYRPKAPGDGLGNVCLSDEEARDPVRLDEEAVAYAEEFCAEEDTDSFWIGCSDFEINCAFVWVIEAARCLAGGLNDPIALKLLKMAVTDIELAKPRQRREKLRAQMKVPSEQL